MPEDEYNPTVQFVLIQIRNGIRGAVGKEGPRTIGHCVYCAGPCELASRFCSVRVFGECNPEE